MIRRTKGLFWSLWYALFAPVQWLRFRFELLRVGVSPEYIRKAFSFLAQLAIEDYCCEEEHGCSRIRIMRAAGLELHVRDEDEKGERLYEFVLFQDHNGDLIVHEWREKEREVPFGFNEVGKPITSHWHEVFRWGHRIENLKFVQYLKKLYGVGPNLESDSKISNQIEYVR